MLSVFHWFTFYYTFSNHHSSIDSYWKALKLKGPNWPFDSDLQLQMSFLVKPNDQSTLIVTLLSPELTVGVTLDNISDLPFPHLHRMKTASDISTSMCLPFTGAGCVTPAALATDRGSIGLWTRHELVLVNLKTYFMNIHNVKLSGITAGSGLVIAQAI